MQVLPYFYDGQQRRFLEQIVRAFSGWGYMKGSTGGNPPSLQIVPCRMASTNRVVANIMRNQSEDTLLTAPMITVWQTELKGREKDLQNRNHVDTVQVVERGIDPDTGEYTSARGQGYTVQRLMPLPFDMMVQVDIWTTNVDQKQQLLEQILTAMWPNFDIQNSDNPLDWTALTTAYVEDITYSSKNIQVGNTDEIDVTTLQLRVPMWLSPPAKVQQQTLIEQIITNIHNEAVLPSTSVILDSVGEPSGDVSSIVTPGDFHISISGSSITLVGPEGRTLDENGNPYTWEPLLELYGALRPSISLLAIKTTENFEGPQVVGTIQLNNDNPSELVWSIDPSTLPANTLATVNAVIMPLEHYPITGGLAAPTEGTRYLILQDLGPSVAWGNLHAGINDIIQYTSGNWTVSFDASAHANTGVQYVLNHYSSNQYKWTGTEWVFAIDGIYHEGYWRLWL